MLATETTRASELLGAIRTALTPMRTPPPPIYVFVHASTTAQDRLAVLYMERLASFLYLSSFVPAIRCICVLSALSPSMLKTS